MQKSRITSLKIFKIGRKEFVFYALLGLLILVILIEIWILDVFPKEKNSTSKNILQSMASQVVLKCKGNQNRPSCYDKEIPKLMSTISMEEAFAVTRIVQDIDKSYPYCHVLGHELSAAEVRKDPTKWKDVVTRCPSGMCSNGCIHGGFQEKFRAETLSNKEIEEVKPDLATICESRNNWKPTGLEQASCYHALGHLTMYITNGQVKDSLDLCGELALKSEKRDYRKLCYDGVFMQIFQPLEPEDFVLVESIVPTKESLVSFCNQFESSAKSSCLSEAWPLYRSEIKDPIGLKNFCELQEKDNVKRCYSVMFNIIASGTGLNSESIGNFCQKLPITVSGQCVAKSAARMIEVDYRNIDRAVALCKDNLNIDPNNECFKEMVLYAGYNFKLNSPEYYQLCNALTGQWKNECLDKSKNTN